jgi:HEAT repeat protein
MLGSGSDPAAQAVNAPETSVARIEPGVIDGEDTTPLPPARSKVTAARQGIRGLERDTEMLDAAAISDRLRRAHELIASADLRLRYDGLRILAEERPGEAVPEILAFLEAADQEERVSLQRLAAVSLLGRLDGVWTGPELSLLYRQGDAGIRKAAAKALASQGDASLVERELSDLRTALADPDGGVRARAAEEVGAFAGPLAVEVLLPLLGDENSAVRARAVDGLGVSGDGSLVTALQPLLEDRVELVRDRARRAIQALQAGDGGIPGGG